MSIPSWAVRGAKVVCVYNHVEHPRPGEVFPAKGQIYTIREVAPSEKFPDEAIAAFAELENPLLRKGGKAEAMFRLKYFRPLVPRSQEQDVAIFAPMLKTGHRVTEKLGEDA